MSRVLATAFFLVCLGLPFSNVRPADAADPRPLSGNVIESRVTTDVSVFVWDATPYVRQLVKDQMLGADGIKQMEATALLQMAQSAKTSTTRFIQLEAVYQKLADFNPAYGGATLAGMETVFTMRATRAFLRALTSVEAETIPGGNAPNGLMITLTGELPKPL